MSAIEFFVSFRKQAGFLGRYLAAGDVPSSIVANKQRIMEQMDPDGSYAQNNLLLNGDMIRRQRELGYDHLRDYEDRASAGGYGANALAGGVVGGALGGAAGLGMMAAGGANGHEALGLGTAGAGIGATLALLARAWQKNKALHLIGDEDISAMKEQQRDRGFGSEFVPGRDIYDAYHAKAASAAGSLWDLAAANPEVTGALAGGTIGGITGLFSDDRGSVARNALVGAGLGGLGGFGYRMMGQGGPPPPQYNNSDVLTGLGGRSGPRAYTPDSDPQKRQDFWDKNPQRRLHVFDNPDAAANEAEISEAGKHQEALQLQAEHPIAMGMARAVHNPLGTFRNQARPFAHNATIIPLAAWRGMNRFGDEVDAQADSWQKTWNASRYL